MSTAKESSNKTSGTTRARVAVENGLAICMAHQQSVLSILQANQAAITADMADDIPYKEADDLLHIACQLCPDDLTDLKSLLLRAVARLKVARGLDLGDTTKERLAGLLVGYQDHLEMHEKQYQNILRTL